jgi:hypothetical protein
VPQVNGHTAADVVCHVPHHALEILMADVACFLLNLFACEPHVFPLSATRRWYKLAEEGKEVKHAMQGRSFQVRVVVLVSSSAGH